MRTRFVTFPCSVCTFCSGTCGRCWPCLAIFSCNRTSSPSRPSRVVLVSFRRQQQEQVNANARGAGEFVLESPSHIFTKNLVHFSFFVSLNRPAPRKCDTQPTHAKSRVYATRFDWDGDARRGCSAYRFSTHICDAVITFLRRERPQPRWRRSARRSGGEWRRRPRRRSGCAAT